MPRSWSHLRFDVLELLAIVGFVALCSAVFMNMRFQAQMERDLLPKKYGPARYSFGVEELAIRDFFQDRRGGFFVDIGASHYKKDSNTYYLEERLGWSGIAVDALREYEADYQRYRPHTRFFAGFVSDVTGDQSTLFVPADKRQSSDFRRPDYGPAEERKVPTITLDNLLEQQHVQGMDLLSLDIEMSEPKALAGFDVERFRPALVCVEAHLPVRQQILDYFARHGYTVVGKYLRADPNNLYFAPLQPRE